jgi:acyl-CoA reductase-like NAD-dependent aldehyde dehydrogenase
MAIAREEVFGPVSSIIKATGLDSALKTENSVKFGLIERVYEGLGLGHDNPSLGPMSA